MIDPGVLISDAIAAPALGQWLLLFACASELIVTNSWLLVLIQGEIVTIKGGGGSVPQLSSCQHGMAKPGRASDSSGQGTQLELLQLQVNSWVNGQQIHNFDFLILGSCW